MASFRRASWFSRVELGSFASLQNVAVAIFSLFLAAGLSGGQAVSEQNAHGLGLVRLSKPFFDPSDGQTIDVILEIRAAGQLDVVLLDRDGFRVRKLLTGEAVLAGEHRASWDGRDDNGAVVADEAYSLWITLKTAVGVSKYVPSETPPQHVEAKIGYYDRATGVFRYDLPVPARVHVQAGTARLKKGATEKTGPVLKNLANREPRPSGPVIENWNGLDESGSVFVPDLPDFVMALAATSLPENAIIAYGNRSKTFLEVAAQRVGAPLSAVPAATDHHHHAGLTALEDVAPSLRVSLEHATYSTRTRAWNPEDNRLIADLILEGPSATSFSAEPAKIYVFIDGKLLQSLPPSKPATRIDVSLSGVESGHHIVALNWVSDFGPVAVATMQLDMPPKHAGGNGVGK